MADTRNFELEFEANDDGSFTVRVPTDAGSRATVTFKLPYSQAEFERVIGDMGNTRKVRRYEDPAEAMARTFGGRLFEAAISGEVLDAFNTSLSDAERQGAALRVRLNFEKALQLTDLPWEFLYAPARQDYLALSANTPLVRSIDIPHEHRRALTVTPPLTLGLIISSPRDCERLDVDREVANVTEALEKLEADGSIVVLRIPPTREGLLTALHTGKVNILHFIGHGGFDEATGDGTLILETGTRGADELRGTVLGQMVSGRAALRMVVLNSCVGARSTATDPFAGVANALLLRNIPAVVAMQFEITDRAAVKFAERFYTALASGVPVDIAVGRARQTLRLVERNLVEWATPVLYLQTNDARIFGPTPQPVKPNPPTSVDEELEQAWDEDEVAGVTSQIRERLKEGDFDGAESDYQTASHKLRRHPDMVAIETELRDYRQARGVMGTAKLLADARQWRDVLDRVRSIADAGIALPGLEELRVRAEAAVEKQKAEARLRSALTTASAAAAAESWQGALDALMPPVAADADLEPAGLTDARELIAKATVQLQLARIAARMRDAHERGHWRAVLDAHEDLQELNVEHPDDLDALAAAARQSLAAATLQERLDAEYEAALTLLQNERWEEARTLLGSIDDANSDYRGVQRLMATTDRNIELGAAIDEASEAAAVSEWGRVVFGLQRIIEDRDAYTPLSRFTEADALHQRAIEEVGTESALRAAEYQEALEKGRAARVAEFQEALEKGRAARAERDWEAVAKALHPVAGSAKYRDLQGYSEAVEMHGLSEVMLRIADAGGEGTDTLTRIGGIGPATAERLRQLGIVRLAQIAAFTPQDLRALATALGSRVTVGRIEAEDWIGQAERLSRKPARKQRAPIRTERSQRELSEKSQVKATKSYAVDAGGSADRTPLGATRSFLSWLLLAGAGLIPVVVVVMTIDFLFGARPKEFPTWGDLGYLWLGGVILSGLAVVLSMWADPDK